MSEFADRTSDRQLAIEFIPDDALPPEANISDALRRLSQSMAETIWTQSTQPSSVNVDHLAAGILRAVRLLAPFGELTGLAAPSSGQVIPILCVLVRSFLRQAGSPEIMADDLERALTDPAIQAAHPDLRRTPRPNDNVIFDTHARLATCETYGLLAPLLQVGLVALLARTDWQRTDAAARTLDARLAGPGRVIPLLQVHEMAAAITDNKAAVCGALIWRVARDLTHLKTDAPLDDLTRTSYFRDTCSLLTHPEWAASVQRDTPLGRGNPTRLTEARLLAEDDDPPETDLAPDCFREAKIARIESRVRRVLHPDSSLAEIGEGTHEQHGLAVYGEEYAVLRELHRPSDWNCTHPNELVRAFGKLLRPEAGLKSFSDEQLATRAVLLSLVLTGRASKWLLTIVIGDWSSAQSDPAQVVAPRYVPSADIIVYRPEAMPDLPKRPVRSADLFEPISPIWILPLPEPLIPWYRELARRRQTGAPLFPVDPSHVRTALKWMTDHLQETMPRVPRITEGRLRATYRALMETTGELDPLLTAFISEQWTTSLRVPLFYTTVRSAWLAEQYRASANKVWQLLRHLNDRLPEYAVRPAHLPNVRFGSPYFPRLDVLKNALATLDSLIENTPEAEALHNARLLKLLYGLSLFCGLRISEAGGLRALQMDLPEHGDRVGINWLTLPETRGNRWTTAARILPLPPYLQPLIRALLCDEGNGPAFYFLARGRRVPATADAIRDQLNRIGVAFPRWHAGRHFVRTLMLECGLKFDDANAIIGHQSAGRELHNPYSPQGMDSVWTAYLTFTHQIAALIDWKETI